MEVRKNKNNVSLLIISVIIMVCLSINAYTSLESLYNTSITLYELIMEQFNNINVVAFLISIIVLFFFTTSITVTQMQIVD